MEQNCRNSLDFITTEVTSKYFYKSGSYKRKGANKQTKKDTYTMI